MLSSRKLEAEEEEGGEAEEEEEEEEVVVVVAEEEAEDGEAVAQAAGRGIPIRARAPCWRGRA